MSDVAGSYNCTVNSPLGEQKSVLTVNDNGDGTWTGTNAGDTGVLDCNDGKVDGNTITWKSDMKVPMPMTLECTATIDGNALTGQVKAGMFGSFPMSGTRA
jgi:hypothetical protein